MHIWSVRITLVTAMALAVPTSHTALRAQNPITAARDAFRRAQEEARRRAEEDARRRAGAAAVPRQPAPGSGPAAPRGGPAPASAAATNGGTAEPAGTPESTAALATAASFVDVGGLTLGMPIAATAGAVRALNPALKGEPPSVVAVWPIDPNASSRPIPANAPQSVQSVVYQAAAPWGLGEIVTLRFALHPNAPVVTHIERKVVYEREKGPQIDAVLQGLRTKYGPESAVVNDTTSGPSRSVFLRWFFESGEQPLRGNLATRMKTCPGLGGHAGDGTPCLSLIVLEAMVAANGNGVVLEFEVRTASNPLITSAADATDTFLRQLSEEQAKQQRDESSKRAVPKL